MRSKRVMDRFWALTKDCTNEQQQKEIVSKLFGELAGTAMPTNK
jgi:hypothetical protein